MLVIKIFSKRKKVFRERKKCEKIRAKRSNFLNGAVTSTSLGKRPGNHTSRIIDEITLAKALEALKTSKPKIRGTIIREHEEPSESRTTTTISLKKSQDKEEQQELNDEEKATLFMQLLEKRRKFFTVKRAKEKRNRPPTKTQQRSIVCAYLNNMEGYKPNSLKNKSFADIQELFDKTMKRVNTFVDYRTELVEESLKKRKKKGKESYYQIIKADGSSKKYLVFSHMLKDFDREDVKTLWKLVKDKNGSTRPEEGYERVIWGDLKTDCNNTLTKLRTKFENAFNLEFKERMQKYTRFNAQSFQDAMICNMDSIGKYMLEIILHQQRTSQLLKQKKLMQIQEDHSNPIQALNVDSLKVDLVVIQNTCSEKEDSNSETASNKSVKESSLDYATKDIHAIIYKMSKAKERCMAYFRSLHSHLQVLSKEDLKGTHIKHGFKRAFMPLFGQDDDTFTSTMLLNVDQLQKQLNKDEFQEDGSMMHMQESKIGMGKAVDTNLVVTESSGTESEVQDDSSRPGNDIDADDVDIRPIYDEEPMAKVQLTAECNIFAIGQHHTEQLEISHEGRVGQYLEQCQVQSPMLDSSLDNQTTEYSKQSLSA
nr:hypothetical protein [Tanacetum cinerariifolium]